MLVLELGAWNSCLTVVFPWRCWPWLYNEGQVQRWGLGKCLWGKLVIPPGAILEPLQGLPRLPMGGTQCLAWCLMSLLAWLLVTVLDQTHPWLFLEERALTQPGAKANETWSSLKSVLNIVFLKLDLRMPSALAAPESSQLQVQQVLARAPQFLRRCRLVPCFWHTICKRCLTTHGAY